MEWTTIYVSSVTNAMQGKRLLEKQGYTVHVQRSSRVQEDTGCGYSLLVRGNADRATELLKKNGIRVLRVAGGGDGR
ncbi:MAG: DUF3343 domain-containing protein [Clostridia bacterium]|nr:DUF3343 domain-containing protein [Clostridia bacterium]